MLSLGAISFLHPFVLLGLLALPALWLLLRALPPQPRRQTFPPLLLLRRLARSTPPPQATPLWLILLRLVLAALVFLALSGPIYNPGPSAERDGPLLIVVDNGWEAASGWDRRRAFLERLLAIAARDGRSVILLPTAAGPGASPESERQPPPSPETAEALRRRLAGLDPVPFSPDHESAATRIEEMSTTPGAIVWLSDGLEHPGRPRLEAALAALGEPAVYADTAERTPLALLPLDTTGAGLGVTVRRPARDLAAEVTVVARGAGGRRLAEARAQFAAGSDTARAQIDLPLEVRNSVARVEIAGDHSAGTTILLDARAGRPRVGLSAGERRMESEPLRSPLFYLRRALEPFAELADGPVDDLLANRPDVLVLADVGHMAPRAESAVRQFVEGGGLLIRFAGPHMEAASDDLVPVRLRSGARAVGGALSWEKPQPLGPFPETGPFAGLPVPDNVTVTRQLLAVPALDLNEHVWARLADGTPLVTGDRRGRGTLVLVHTSADAEWSNLVLSGLFVDMLKRLLLLARQPAAAAADRAGPATLAPFALIDGFGRLGPAPEGAPAIAARDFAHIAASPAHPPGLYGPSSAPLALNLASANGPIDTSFRFRPVRGPIQSLEELERTDQDLAPALLVGILLLILADIVASLVLRGIAIPSWPRRVTTALFLLASCIPVLATRAEAAPPSVDPDFAVAATAETRLGYVRTGDPRIDRLTEAGLKGLGRVLELRTAVHLGAPMALDPERDPLTLFPLVYWPVPADTPPPGEAALKRLSAFLASGGIVLFDTGVGDPADVSLGIENPVALQALQRLLARLDLPPLVRVEGRHILARSFYLLDSFPGRISGRAIWVTADSAADEPRVSPLVIGGGDWAAAWAIDDRDHYLVPTLAGGIAQRERAFRFGVNLVMYALTGTYKGDQLHLPALIERLGE